MIEECTGDEGLKDFLWSFGNRRPIGDIVYGGLHICAERLTQYTCLIAFNRFGILVHVIQAGVYSRSVFAIYIQPPSPEVTTTKKIFVLSIKKSILLI